MSATLNQVRRRIPLAQPDVGERELEPVTQVLRRDQLALGPFADRFEAAVAALAGRREGLACSSRLSQEDSGYVVGALKDAVGGERG
jgi:dTDP-4-amino-4,6-dideoxygalactose transaminase